jgi:formylglycine-generating enzyme required for sulfatase activity
MAAIATLTACGDDADDPSYWGPRGEAGTDASADVETLDVAEQEAQADATLDDPSLSEADVAAEPEAAGPCPADMVLVGASCFDRFEAPNHESALPLVMFSFLEAESWCAARDKRLCFDDDWMQACAGTEEWSYVYGDAHEPGVCNDDKIWKTYDQPLLNGWPWNLDTDGAEALAELLDLARAASAAGAAAADHVEAIYQADPSGSNAGCYNAEGVADLTGNIEEWTQRRDGGTTDFHGNLKGRYWAESRTCQSNIITHGDAFRFYEIGFRCCRDPS